MATAMRIPASAPAGAPWRRRLPACVFAAMPVAFAGVVYWPIVHNYFHVDDFFHLYQIANGGFLDFILTPFGGHLCVVRNTVFWLCHRAFGTAPAPYFALVLVTHLLNVLLLFRVIARFTGSWLLACLGAALWGTSPLHEAVLGWYSVYGQVLVGTALLLVLARLGARLESAAAVGAKECLIWAVLLVVASLSFGIGIALAAVFPLVFWLLVPRPLRDRRGLAVLAAVPFVVALLYVVLYWRFRIEADSPLAAIGPTPGGGPLGSLGVFLHYATALPAIATMWMHLVGYGLTALVLGFGNAPLAYPDRFAIGLAVVVAGALLAAAAVAGATVRRRMLALLLLCLAAYGAVAVGRGGVYVALFGERARAVLEPRYQYVALIPLTVLLATTVAQLGTRLPEAARVGPLLAAVALGALVAAYAAFRRPIDHHDTERVLVARALAAIESEVHAQPGPTVVVPNRKFEPAVLEGEQFPGWAGVFIIWHPRNEVDGRRVLFTATPGELAEAARTGGRITSLLVPADDGTARP